LGSLLTINIGNTRVGLGRFVPAPDGEGAPDPTAAASFPLPHDGLFEPAFDFAGVTAAIIASVNPDADAAIADWVERRVGVRPLHFPQDTPGAVHVRCDEPQSVGADRLANAVGAWCEFRTACVIVDAGTAITVDAVDAQGAFLGGAILPGIELCTRALGEHTALLPQLDLADPATAIGTNTPDAIASGVLHGLAGALDRLIDDVSEELDLSANVIATGGDAPRLSALCRVPLEPRPHLTLAGLAVAVGTQRT
jgi:type III pantothenate kinase